MGATTIIIAGGSAKNAIDKMMADASNWTTAQVNQAIDLLHSVRDQVNAMDQDFNEAK